MVSFLWHMGFNINHCSIVAFESLARWQQEEQAVSGMVIVFKCPRSAEETPHLISIIDWSVITHPSLPVFNCSHPIPVNDLHSLDAFYCFCVKACQSAVTSDKITLKLIIKVSNWACQGFVFCVCVDLLQFECSKWNGAKWKKEKKTGFTHISSQVHLCKTFWLFCLMWSY